MLETSSNLDRRGRGRLGQPRYFKRGALTGGEGYTLRAGGRRTRGRGEGKGDGLGKTHQVYLEINVHAHRTRSQGIVSGDGESEPSRGRQGGRGHLGGEGKKRFKRGILLKTNIVGASANIPLQKGIRREGGIHRAFKRRSWYKRREKMRGESKWALLFFKGKRQPIGKNLQKEETRSIDSSGKIKLENGMRKEGEPGNGRKSSSALKRKKQRGERDKLKKRLAKDAGQVLEGLVEERGGCSRWVKERKDLQWEEGRNSSMRAYSQAGKLKTFLRAADRNLGPEEKTWERGRIRGGKSSGSRKEEFPAFVPTGRKRGGRSKIRQTSRGDRGEKRKEQAY